MSSSKTSDEKKADRQRLVMLLDHIVMRSGNSMLYKFNDTIMSYPSSSDVLEQNERKATVKKYNTLASLMVEARSILRVEDDSEKNHPIDDGQKFAMVIRDLNYCIESIVDIDNTTE